MNRMTWQEVGEDRYQSNVGDAEAVVYRSAEGLWFCEVSDTTVDEVVYTGEEGFRMRSGAMQEAADVVNDLGMA